MEPSDGTRGDKMQPHCVTELVALQGRWQGALCPYPACGPVLAMGQNRQSNVCVHTEDPHVVWSVVGGRGVFWESAES